MAEYGYMAYPVPNSGYGVYEADLITHSIPDETAIPSDGHNYDMPCEISFCLVRTNNLRGTWNRHRRREGGIESPFFTANSLLPSASDRDA